MFKYIKSSKELEFISNECPEERETSINIEGNSHIMKIYTSDNVMLNKLKKILDANPDTVKCWEAGRLNGLVTGYFFEMPKKHLTLRMSVGREVSEEQRIATGERIKKLHAEGKMKGKK